MSLLEQFRMYDPYMTFCKNSPCYKRRAFRDRVGCISDFEGQKEQLSALWTKGQKAYETVAINLEKQPTAEDFNEIAVLVSGLAIYAKDALGKATSELGIQAKDIETGAPVTNFVEHPDEALQCAEAIFIHLMTIDGAEAGLPSLEFMYPQTGSSLKYETMLYAMAINAIDDYLAACLSANGEYYAYQRVERFFAAAETIAITKATAKAERSKQARKAAEAKAEKYYDRDGAIIEWNINGPAYSSPAAFARQRHKDFNYTDPAHLARIIRRDGKKHPKKLK